MSRGRRVALTIAVATVLLGGLYGMIARFRDPPAPQAGLADSFRLEIPPPDPDAPGPAFATTYEAFPVFKALQGETLTLTIHSARPGSVHIHGYEQYVDLVPHSEVTLRFEAKTAGLFPIHLHGHDEMMVHLATFEIQPK